MKELQTEISISASPDRVWSILTNYENHARWNPFIKSIQGDKKAGGRLRVEIKPPEAGGMVFKPVIKVFDQGKEFRWKGKMLVSGLFDGEHYFLLSSNGNGKTKFVQGEIFNGILVGAFGKTLEKTKKGFELMNEALMKECEK